MAGSNAGSSGGPNTIGLVGNLIAKPLNSGYSFILQCLCLRPIFCGFNLVFEALYNDRLRFFLAIYRWKIFARLETKTAYNKKPITVKQRSEVVLQGLNALQNDLISFSILYFMFNQLILKNYVLKEKLDLQQQNLILLAG